MPRLAVNLLVLNGAAVLRRCLLPLKGVVDELVVVDSGSEDDTRDVLEQIAAEMGLDRYRYERLHPYSDMFFTDERASWEACLPEPFTGRRLMRDWAAARNLALQETTADYVLKMDADDELVSPPEDIRNSLEYLDSNPQIDIVASSYLVMDGKGTPEWRSMYDRLWRRSGGLRWARVMHEYLSPKTTFAEVYWGKGLEVVDHRDSPGRGVRVQHRNLKTLLYHWEHMDPKHSAVWADRSNPLFVFTLAHEAVEVFPVFARELLADVLGWTNDISLQTYCHYHIGRTYEAQGAFDKALASYQTADVLWCNTQALLKEWDLAKRLDMTEITTELAATLLVRVGALESDELPYNCDLKLVSELRQDYKKERQ